MNDRAIDKTLRRPGGRIAGIIRYWLIGIAIAAIGSNALAEQLVAEFSGDRSKVTDEFNIEGPWLLDWHVSGDYSETTGIEIDLVDAVFLAHMGVVLETRQPGGGTKLFYDSGRFRFRIIATAANWRLRVSKISKTEAERMIPTRP